MKCNDSFCALQSQFYSNCLMDKKADYLVLFSRFLTIVFTFPSPIESVPMFDGTCFTLTWLLNIRSGKFLHRSTIRLVYIIYTIEPHHS